MPCTLESPCCGPVVVKLKTQDFTIRECVQAHSFREDHPKPKEILTDWRHAHVSRDEVGGVVLVQAPYRPESRCSHCSLRQNYNKDPEARCANHGGPSRIERDKRRREEKAPETHARSARARIPATPADCRWCRNVRAKNAVEGPRSRWGRCIHHGGPSETERVARRARMKIALTARFNARVGPGNQWKEKKRRATA